MKNNFQTILIGIFLAFFLFAVLIFSGLLPIKGIKKTPVTKIQGSAVLWGTFPDLEISKLFQTISSNNEGLQLTYVEKNKDTYQDDLIEAFASNKGPDLFFISDDMVLKNEKFIYKLPYEAYSEKNFKNSFIDGAKVFLTKDGVIGLPVVADPLVLYYNKNLLGNANLVSPPKTWNELKDLGNLLTDRKSDGTILESMIALGGFSNINNAKDILSLLLIQFGNPIVERIDDQVTPVINQNFDLTPAPLVSVLNFFTEFSDPFNNVYSWNRGMIDSKDLFTGGRLALYLGFSSELFEIESINPNLSFDVAEMMQLGNDQNGNKSTKRNYGRIYALAINNQKSQNPNLFGILGLLTSPETVKEFSSVALFLPPARQDLLKDKPVDNKALDTFYDSVITMQTWLDPDKEATDKIFKEMVENVLSSKTSLEDAGSKAQGQLYLLTQKQ